MMEHVVKLRPKAKPSIGVMDLHERQTEFYKIRTVVITQSTKKNTKESIEQATLTDRRVSSTKTVPVQTAPIGLSVSVIYASASSPPARPHRRDHRADVVLVVQRQDIGRIDLGARPSHWVVLRMSLVVLMRRSFLHSADWPRQQSLKM
jgi:hypothetical protein